jgi:hypothetical protein
MIRWLLHDLWAIERAVDIALPVPAAHLFEIALGGPSTRFDARTGRPYGPSPSGRPTFFEPNYHPPIR